MTEKKLIRVYNYQGKEIGELVEMGSGERKEREFRTELTDNDVIDFVREMKPETKVHMKHNAYGIYRLLQHFGINPDDYVDNEDIMIYVANKGYKSLTELNHGDKRAWELVKQRDLEAELFSDFKK